MLWSIDLISIAIEVYYVFGSELKEIRLGIKVDKKILIICAYLNLINIYLKKYFVDYKTI